MRKTTSVIAVQTVAWARAPLMPSAARCRSAPTSASGDTSLETERANSDMIYKLSKMSRRGWPTTR
ncbi:MAG TPA: hypothetical protein VGM82_05265, partial [Gemmatimonadaceae bacterium]